MRARTKRRFWLIRTVSNLENIVASADSLAVRAVSQKIERIASITDRIGIREPPKPS